MNIPIDVLSLVILGLGLGAGGLGWIIAVFVQNRKMRSVFRSMCGVSAAGDKYDLWIVPAAILIHLPIAALLGVMEPGSVREIATEAAAYNACRLRIDKLSRRPGSSDDIMALYSGRMTALGRSERVALIEQFICPGNNVKVNDAMLPIPFYVDENGAIKCGTHDYDRRYVVNILRFLDIGEWAEAERLRSASYVPNLELGGYRASLFMFNDSRCSYCIICPPSRHSEYTSDRYYRK